jgi:phosphatidylglycerol lysyltransferase
MLRSAQLLVQCISMRNLSWLRQQLRIRQQFGVEFVSIVVAAHGLFILATTLLDQLAARHGTRLTTIRLDVPLLIGLTLLYLSLLLRRRKRTAWTFAVGAYTFYLGLNLVGLLEGAGAHEFFDLGLIRAAVLPVAILGLLLVLRTEFVVQSDLQGFRTAVRSSLLVLLVAFIYGVTGFLLMDRHDFHQEISVTGAVHHTLDQFELTTKQPLRAYTKRAQLFTTSLSFVSIAAVAYAVFSLFQPLRSRFTDQTTGRQFMAQLLKQASTPSEDFFKLWPHDKQYFFDSNGTSGLALHVYRGIALCLGDPVGEPARFKVLLKEFQAVCYSNDWVPAFIHIEKKYQRLYEAQDFSLQKIGQEAVLDLHHFHETIATGKYFRQIRNRFQKQDYSYKLLRPPHHKAVIERLKTISDEWLAQPGRSERGFVMGYFTEEYMQQCAVMVVRDGAGTIQAFLNQVPADFDTAEATYDLLRYGVKSAGNINDFLLMGFIEYLSEAGYERLNLGLCPLAGLDENDQQNQTLIDSVLGFAYANGDRFYSFSGLYRFKNKYEPDWQDRYVAYQGGVRGFSRTMNALLRAMRVRQH